MPESRENIVAFLFFELLILIGLIYIIFMEDLMKYDSDLLKKCGEDKVELYKSEKLRSVNRL